MDNGQKFFRYDMSGQWLKGNTHIHSTASDGGKNFHELADMYAGKGYRFLFRTDHWMTSNVESETANYPLLWLDGMEVDGRDSCGAPYHVVFLGRSGALSREMGLVSAMGIARAEGAFMVLAHPHWTGNTLEDSLRWDFHAVEVYNHVSQWMNGRSESLVHWNAMLKANPNTLGLASDDAHISKDHPGWNGGWIVVNAAECTRAAIMNALRRGNYYSSCGPEYHDIRFDGANVSIRTSPVRFVRLVGQDWMGERRGSFDGELLTEATFPVHGDWTYMYLEIQDDSGKRAWTNPLFQKAIQ